MTITLEAILAKLPIGKLSETIGAHIRPLTRILPDKRLGAVVESIILGILGGQTPVITGMARTNSKADGETWPIAKRIYRFLCNQRVKTENLYQGLYQIGLEMVEREGPEYLVVAVDPVNFEKPYAEAIEGVSVVHKATPPGLDGKARLAHGYPAITATVVNTKVPVTSYANWFSYKTADFISQNEEIEQAFETTHRLYPQYKVRFVGDSGLDDQKMFVQVENLKREFAFRVSHLERIVEVYNERLDRWETEALKDLVEVVPYQVTFKVLFTHAGRTHLDTVQFGWFKVRIPGTTSMRKSNLSRVDVATEAQTERFWTILPYALFGEPLQGSVLVGVQSRVLLSQPRSDYLQVEPSQSLGHDLSGLLPPGLAWITGNGWELFVKNWFGDFASYVRGSAPR